LFDNKVSIVGKQVSPASISHHWLMSPCWAAQTNITDVESATVYMIGKINSQMGQLVVCAEHGECFLGTTDRLCRTRWEGVSGK